MRITITSKRVIVFLLLAIATLLATLLVILCFLPIIGGNLPKVISSNLFVHLLFNSLIIAIVSKERYRSSRDELNMFYNNNFAHEKHGETSSCDNECNVYKDDLECGGDYGECHEYDQYDSNGDSTTYDSDEDNTSSYSYIDDEDSSYNDSDDEDSSYDDSHGSDGYDEDDDDDDDNNSYGDVWWEDEEDEEYDSELERKIEAFIAKVINGWKEEWFSDNMQT